MSVLRVEAADECELADPPADGATALLVEEDNVDVVSVPEALGPEESRVAPVALLQRVVLVMRHGGEQPSPTYIFMNILRISSWLNLHIPFIKARPLYCIWHSLAIFKSIDKNNIT